MNCTECGNQILSQRLKLIPTATLCAECQAEDDVFKYKMKLVNFDESPTMAKTKKDWELLRKQRAVKDI